MADDKLTIEQLEKLAHMLYEEWVESRADEDWQAWLRVKKELDRRKGLT